MNFDFGVFKNFPISEKAGFDFRWENFNLFNHTQFNQVSGNGSSGGSGANIGMDTPNPGANLDSSNFLHATGAHFARRMQFGLRFYF